MRWRTLSPYETRPSILKCTVLLKCIVPTHLRSTFFPHILIEFCKTGVSSNLLTWVFHLSRDSRNIICYFSNYLLLKICSIISFPLFWLSLVKTIFFDSVNFKIYVYILLSFNALTSVKLIPKNNIAGLETISILNVIDFPDCFPKKGYNISHFHRQCMRASFPGMSTSNRWYHQFWNLPVLGL